MMDVVRVVVESWRVSEETYDCPNVVVGVGQIVGMSAGGTVHHIDEEEARVGDCQQL